MKLKIGTRKSPLALAQANEVKAKLEAAWPGLSCELVHITTSGDRFTDRPLSNIGGKGLFTKEIEEALIDRSIDIAVHSMKDMQTVLPDGLIIGCMLPREDPRDMMVGQGITSINDIEPGASFGTASLRRSAQLLMVRPDLRIVPLRGSVETRLLKIEKGEARASLLAVAGLNRLGITDKVPGFVLSLAQCLPAVAQGAIGIECRADDSKVRELLVPLSHADTEAAVACEREFLRMLDGSCRTPIAGYAEIHGNELQFTGLIIKPDGSAHHRVEMKGPKTSALKLGKEAGQDLLARAGKGFISS